MNIDWDLLERTIRRDRAARGLASYRDDADQFLLPGHLRRAAIGLAEFSRRVLIVTGFPVVSQDCAVAGETDGPLGALFLAGMLEGAGIEAQLATDLISAPLLRAGLGAAGLDPASLVVFDELSNDAASRAKVADWREQFARTRDQYSHLVFIERVGPGHTRDSIAAHDIADPALKQLEEFEQLVALDEQDRCRNMRGIVLDDVTAPLHELIIPPDTLPREDPTPHTIGIVDGGNEIGCGAIPWRILRRCVAQGPIEFTACRIATDDVIVAGVSNWGAYALGAAVAALRGSRATIVAWTAEKHRRVLDALVAAGALDGVTKQPTPTVDGIALEDYLAMFDEIRAVCLSGGTGGLSTSA